MQQLVRGLTSFAGKFLRDKWSVGQPTWPCSPTTAALAVLGKALPAGQREVILPPCSSLVACTSALCLLLPWEQRLRQLRLLSLQRGGHGGQLPVCVKNNWIKKGMARGSGTRPKQQKSLTNLRQSFFTVSMGKHWNKLPRDCGFSISGDSHDLTVQVVLGACSLRSGVSATSGRPWTRNGGHSPAPR